MAIRASGFAILSTRVTIAPTSSRAGQFYMKFLGPIEFINENGTPIPVMSWEHVQDLWAAQNGQMVPT